MPHHSSLRSHTMRVSVYELNLYAPDRSALSLLANVPSSSMGISDQMCSGTIWLDVRKFSTRPARIGEREQHGRVVVASTDSR